MLRCGFEQIGSTIEHVNSWRPSLILLRGILKNLPLNLPPKVLYSEFYISEEEKRLNLNTWNVHKNWTKKHFMSSSLTEICVANPVKRLSAGQQRSHKREAKWFLSSVSLLSTELLLPAQWRHDDSLEAEKWRNIHLVGLEGSTHGCCGTTVLQCFCISFWWPFQNFKTNNSLCNILPRFGPKLIHINIFTHLADHQSCPDISLYFFAGYNHQHPNAKKSKFCISFAFLLTHDSWFPKLELLLP